MLRHRAAENKLMWSVLTTLVIRVLRLAPRRPRRSDIWHSGFEIAECRSPAPRELRRRSIQTTGGGTPGRQSYSRFPLAGWPASRKAFGNLPSPHILNEPKSLYHAPSGASGSDSRQSFSLYRSSAVILRSRTRSKRWSRSAGGRFVHWILGIYSPKVIRASSFFSLSRSAASLDSANRPARVKKRCFSRLLASMPLSIRSTITRLALVRWALASDLTHLASRAGSETLWRYDLPFAPMTSLYTKPHQYAPRVRLCECRAGSASPVFWTCGPSRPFGEMEKPQDLKNESCATRWGD
jgi:hypothetical protein